MIFHKVKRMQENWDLSSNKEFTYQYFSEVLSKLNTHYVKEEIKINDLSMDIVQAYLTNVNEAGFRGSVDRFSVDWGNDPKLELMSFVVENGY